ncbi:MAG: hypothetical protein ACOYWZ_03955 [Bacillota bacterium]
MKVTVILGAGFSKNSGLPVQSEIPALLVQNKNNNELEYGITLVIKKFMEEVFCCTVNNTYPELDDILNCIDISTNTGHHLSIKYSSMHLGAIRRFLVFRVFSILEERYKYSQDVDKLIKGFINNFDVGFVVLNWDNVLEKYIHMLNADIGIDYVNGGKVLGSPEHTKRNHKSIKLLKIHGSCNWLYCDNCRVLINDMENKYTLMEKAGFKETDFGIFDELKSIKHFDIFTGSAKCLICGDIVSSHIATQSYRKSFRENSYPCIWSEAEDMLANSDKWVFIGYSMPQADYEFKHLLKISELKLSHKKQNRLSIDVVLLNSKNTTMTYKSFFGDKLGIICNEGISKYLKYI